MSDTTITPEERALWASVATARINAVTPERLCEITAQERLVKALNTLEQAEARAEKAESDKAALEEDLEATEKNLKESSGFIEELLSGLKHRFPVQYANLEGDEYDDDVFSAHDLFEHVIDPAVDAAKEQAKAENALVAEVRRLRERVEAWEWLFEVIEYDVYEDHPLSSRCGYVMSDKERETYANARISYAHIEDAAREAVADSEVE